MGAAPGRVGAEGEGVAAGAALAPRSLLCPGSCSRPGWLLAPPAQAWPPPPPALPLRRAGHRPGTGRHCQALRRAPQEAPPAQCSAQLREAPARSQPQPQEQEPGGAGRRLPALLKVPMPWGCPPPGAQGTLTFARAFAGGGWQQPPPAPWDSAQGCLQGAAPGSLLCYPAGWQAHGHARVPQLTAPAAAIPQKLLAGGGHSTVLSRSGHPGDPATCALVLAPACRPRGALRQVGKAKGPCQWLAALHRAAARLLPGALFSPM